MKKKTLILTLALIAPAAYGASTYTTHYSLEKPSDGSTSWGAAIRNDLDTIDTQLFVNGSTATLHIADTSGAHAASAISSTAGAAVCTSSTDVQTFLDCIDSALNSVSPGGGVDIASTQTITGAKTFSSVITGTAGLTLSTFGTGIVHSNVSGSLSSSSIVNADIDAGAGIVDSKLATISTAGKVQNSATTAVSTNTASAIVTRDASGNFSAGTISAALSGNASTATALAANPTDCSAGQKATGIDASGNLTCSAVSLTADVSGTLPVSKGGTGVTANTAESVLIGGGTNPVTHVAPGTVGNVLTSSGSTWVSSAPGAVTKRYWSGSFGTDCNSWEWTTNSYADAPDDASCTLTEGGKANFPTVTKYGANAKAGIVFTPAVAGNYKICWRALVAGTSNPGNLALYDGTDYFAYDDAGLPTGGIRNTVGGCAIRTLTTSAYSVRVHGKNGGSGSVQMGTMASSGATLVLDFIVEYMD